jgi:hypothetical protein
VDGILGWIFFMMYDIDIHQLILGQFRNWKFLDEIPLKKCLKKKKKLSFQRRGDFIDGHCIKFSNFFCLVMFHES